MSRVSPGLGQPRQRGDDARRRRRARAPVDRASHAGDLRHRPLTQQHEGRGRRQRVGGGGDQHRHRHERGRRLAARLGRQHIGQAQPQRQHAAEVAEAPAPAGHASHRFGSSQFGQEGGSQRLSVRIGDVGHDDGDDRPPQVTRPGTRQRSGAEHAHHGAAGQQALLDGTQIGIGAERGQGEHHDQARRGDRQRPRQRAPGRALRDDADEVRVEDRRQHDGGVARVGEVVHRPAEHLALAHAVVEQTLREQVHRPGLRAVRRRHHRSWSPVGDRLASTLSMRLPSRSTTSKRQPSHSTLSVVFGRRPSSSMIMPASVL